MPLTIDGLSHAGDASAAHAGGHDGVDPVDILIVDDLPEKLLVFETVLGELKQNLVFARSGADALRQILRRDFAVILLDVNMPDMDGFETAALIRKYRRAAHTPIIFITSYADEVQTARGYSLGAVDYIPSPVVPEILRQKVRVFVELHILHKRIARQAEERIALAASEAALKVAEESTRRSTVLSDLSHALSGVLDVTRGACTVCSRTSCRRWRRRRPWRCCDDDDVVDHVVTRSTLIDDVSTTEDLAPSALPTAHYALLHDALALAPEMRGRGTPFTDGALQMLPLVHGERLIGALWVDGEVTPLGAALLDEVAARAAIAFATASLYRNLQREIAERRQAEARLEESSRRKDEFLAMLAHELRNPLAPIRNAIEVIRVVAPPEPRLRAAADITDRQVRQLTRLVDELLDVAHISQGKIVLQPQCVDLVVLVSQCVEALRGEISERRQSLSLALPGTTVNLRGDATRLAQVINNLLNNAIKYTPDGGSISVGIARESGDDGEFAVVSVSDNGMGIEADLLPRVFDLFEQGKRALDRNQGGLGVGLTLVQRLVKLHGGEVQATSRGTGQGSEFLVRLPCLAEVVPATFVDEVAGPGGPGVPRRILVVDDNADVAETTTLLLTLSGHEVLCAKDGLQALQFAAEFAPEVVLLDIGLPLMDGYEVARRLREMPQTRTSLLIALTGYGQQGDRARGKAAGFDGHLLKPVDPRALGEMIAG